MMANNAKFPTRITHVQKGDPVSAGVASSAPQTLEARTNYLKQVIDNIEAGRALIHYDAAVKSDVEVGNPVFWSTDNQRYEMAKAAVENDAALGTLVATESSDVLGLVLTKKVGNTADIVLWGIVAFSDLTNVIDDSPIVPGRYYLSAVEAGKLVSQRPPITVAVCVVLGPLDACDQNTYVYVMPQMRDFLEDHIHLSFELVAAPAGDHVPPSTGEAHAITNADDTKQGWLPANHSSFNGNAPAGAMFGYNLAAHPGLDRVWPPIPLASCLLEMYQEGVAHDVRGIHVDFSYDFGSILANDYEETVITVEGAMPHDAVLINGEAMLPDDLILQAYITTPGQVTVRAFNATAAPINPSPSTYHLHVFKDPYDLGHIDTLHRVNPNLIQFTSYGIWWMTDCYDQVPWPSDLNTTLSSSSSSAPSAPSSSQSSSSSQAECSAIAEKMWLILSFVKMTFATDKTVVTSLQPASGQPLQYVNCDGEEANTGDLYAKLLLALLLEDEYYGGQVLKGVTDDSKFKRGWAAEGLIAGSSKVSLSSEHQRYATPGDSSSSLVHQGLVTVDINVDPTERELLPQIMVLGDAVQRLYKNIPYIGLKEGRSSGVRATFTVPPEGLPTNPKLKVRVVLFGRATGTLTDLDTSYYRLTRPTAGSPTALTEGDTTLSLDTAIAVNADEAHEVESAEITIAAGDTVHVSLDRALTGSPTYAAEMGLIRIGGVIVPGS
jgi:hypothetical protein